MFDLYAGIDWSGALGRRTKGIQVALCASGNRVPDLLPNPYVQDGVWSRPDVLRWLTAEISAGRRVLAGFDFAFCYPFEDAGAYFPGVADGPETPSALWALVERVCEAEPDFYGAALYKRTDLPYRDHFLAPGWRGPAYRYRQRQTELASASVTVPHPVLKCIGAANVGTGSLAGMRMLHRMRAMDGVRIWPFDPEPGGALTVAEIFPRLFFKHAGADPRAWSDKENLAAACRAYGAEDGALPAIEREDEADALVTAAALRALHGDEGLWAQARNAAARREGWIFGAA